ncbi:MAG: hypothetical protein ACLFQS_09020 [Bacteroidales bacterium]
MKNKEINKELQEIAPGLSNLPNENPFEVPGNYFADLPGQIAQRQNRPVVHPIFLALNTVFQPRFVTAGLTTVVLVLMSYFLFLDSDMSADNNFALYDHESFDEQLAWYSEYQSEVYYELLYETDPDIITQLPEDPNYQEEQTIEYLLQYNDYYMDYPFD